VAAETRLRLDESRIGHDLHAQGYDLIGPVLTVASPDPEDESTRVKIEEVQRRAKAGESALDSEDEIAPLALAYHHLVLVQARPPTHK
jgi:hypothetical protein